MTTRNKYIIGIVILAILIFAYFYNKNKKSSTQVTPAQFKKDAMAKGATSDEADAILKVGQCANSSSATTQASLLSVQSVDQLVGICGITATDVANYKSGIAKLS